VYKELAGGPATSSERRSLIAIKMHELLGLKSKVYIDDMREWSGW
jgi:hypothetical protein